MQGYAFDYWNGLFAPKKVSAQTLRQLHKAVMSALDSPDVKEEILHAFGIGEIRVLVTKP